METEWCGFREEEPGLICPHRLSDRTTGSQPVKSGSTPLGGTNDSQWAGPETCEVRFGVQQ
jgi:hypothetical protein